MARYQAFADSLDVVVRDVGGHVVERFERTGLESMARMDAELESRGYVLEFGGWKSEKVGGGMVHTRRMNK